MNDVKSKIEQRIAEIEAERMRVLEQLQAEAAKTLAPYEAAIGELRGVLAMLAPAEAEE